MTVSPRGIKIMSHALKKSPMPAVAPAPVKSPPKERLAQLRESVRKTVRSSNGTPEQQRKQSISDLNDWTDLRDEANKRFA